MSRSRPGQVLRSALCVLVLASVLAACGRRGRLEPPPDPNAPPAAEQTNKAGFKKRPRNPPIQAPNTPFVLDPLL